MFAKVLHGSARFCEDPPGSDTKEKFLQGSVEVPQSSGRFYRVLKDQ